MTTAPNSEPASARCRIGGGEAAHSDLVAKLVAEAFSGFAAARKPPETRLRAAEIPAVPTA